jgi:hypothetical protein
VAISPGVKKQGREADQTHPSGFAVKTTAALSHLFMAWCLIKHRDNFTSALPHYLYLVPYSSFKEGSS